MAKFLLVDSSFWFAFFDRRDQYHEKAQSILDSLIPQIHVLMLPWPILYETLNTRFARRIEWKRNLRIILVKYKHELIDDSSYRKKAYDLYFNISKTYSLVDLVIREIINDNSYKIDGIITFNENDFRDLCYKSKIEIYS